MKQMGIVSAEIELINAADIALERRNYLEKDEVKHMKVKMLVDSGPGRKTFLANSVAEEFDVVGPIMVKFENRTAACNAFVLNGDSEPLLGAIPKEEMDVLIHPARQELVVNPKHPDGAVLRI